MRPTARILSLVGLLSLTTVAVSQGARATSPGDPPEVIALRFTGRYATQTVDPSRDFWTGNVVSLTTGEVAGTLRHEITCHDRTSFPCLVFQATDTFTLPGGTIVSRGTESVAPYAAKEPGFFHVGIQPEGDSIISATGVFAGRTGRATLKAVHDGREYPAHVSFDDVWLIELHPQG